MSDRQIYRPEDVMLAQDLLGLPIIGDVQANYAQYVDTHPDDVRAHAVDFVRGEYDAILTRRGGSISLTDPGDYRAFTAFKADLLPVARRVAVANNLLAWQNVHYPTETARDAFQRTVLGRLFGHMQVYIPETISDDGKLENARLAVSPTGSGKTVLQATTLREAGIGLPLFDPTTATTQAEKNELLRGLVVVNGRRMIPQYMGISGNNTFRRFLQRDVSITPYYGAKKDVSGEIVVVTKQSLPRAIERGDINPEDYAITIVDEAHHLLGEQLQEMLGELALSRLLAFTATPAYRGNRDLRKRFHHVSVGSMRDFVEQGILNTVKLFSYRETDETGSPEEMAIEMGVRYIQSGRKTVIYCEPGGQSAQAQRVANAINERLGKTEGEEQALAIGVFQSEVETDACLARYTAGDVKLLTTVGMLRESWDEKVDAIVLLGVSNSWVNVEQACGRAMRPGEFETELNEILPKELRPGQRFVSIFSIFGMQDIVSGLRISSSEADEFVDLMRDASPRKSHQPKRPRQPGEGDDAKEREIAPSVITESELLSSAMRSALILEQPVRVATISTAERIRQGDVPVGYHSMQQLAESRGVHYLILRASLDAQQLPYTVVRAKDGTYDRWYGEEAEQYLEDFAPENTLQSLKFTAYELSKMFDMQYSTVSRFLKNKVSGRKEGGVTKYNYEAFDLLLKNFVEVPHSTPDEVEVWTLAQKYGQAVYNFVRYRKLPTMMRRPDLTNDEVDRPDAKRTATMHLSKEDAARVVQQFTGIQFATEAHMSYADIAETAGVSKRTVIVNLTEEEKAKSRPMRVHAVGRDASYLEVEDGLRIAERLRPRKMPLTHTTLPIMVKRTGLVKDRLLRALTNAGYPEPDAIVNLGDVHFGVATYPWSAMQAVEAVHPPKPGEPRVDFELLTSKETAHATKKLLHARDVLSTYLDVTKIDAVSVTDILHTRPTRKLTREGYRRGLGTVALEGNHTKWHAVSTVFQQSQATDAAFGVLFLQAKPTKDALRYDPTGTQLMNDMVYTTLQNMIARVSPFPEGWTARQTLGKYIKDTYNMDISDVLRHLRLRVEHQVVARGSSEIDVYYSGIATRLLQATAKRIVLRAERIASGEDDDTDDF